jgi:hypothetical protein
MRARMSVFLIAFSLASVVSAAQHPQEQNGAYKARAMLMRASIAVKADKDAALGKFTA